MKITAEQALSRIKSNRVQQNQTKRLLKSVSVEDEMTLMRTIKETGENRLYVFKNGGTAIVSPADDELNAELAEFDINDDGDLNPYLVSWLTDYAKEVKYLQENAYGTDASESGDGDSGEAEVSSDVIGPLLGSIEWHQRAPFNNKLHFTEISPKNGIVEECAVGCPATALAQVVFYWYKQSKKIGCVSTPNYVTNSYGYQMSITNNTPNITFDYENILDVYTKYKNRKGINIAGISYSDAQANAVAELCAHVGKVIKMEYSPDGSGQTIDATKTAMELGLRLGPVDLYAEKKDVNSKLHLDKVKNALKNGIPVIVSGKQDEKGHGGHQFVCDGYNPNTNLYHINWGWGPNYGNGWFAMNALKSFSYCKKFLIMRGSPRGESPLNYDLNGDNYVNMTDVSLFIKNTSNIIRNEVATIFYDLYRRTGAFVRPVRKDIPTSDEHAYVDFGLESGTLWATCNIGAESETDYGDFLAWGENTPKTTYYWDNYEWGNGNESTHTAINIGQNIVGTKYDAAYVRWGNGWQMPTREDFLELKNDCVFQLKTTNNGCYVEVRKKGAENETDNEYILFPINGYRYRDTYDRNDIDGFYWTGEAKKANGTVSTSAIKIGCFDISLANIKVTDIETAKWDYNYDGYVTGKDVEVVINTILNKS